MMRHFFAALMPFVMLGIAIVAFAFGLMLMVYLFIFGAILGSVLFLIAWIKQKFFPSKHIVKKEQKVGRTFDHQD